jgi:alpha-1,3-rhamnosyl/mannosyltransferase
VSLPVIIDAQALSSVAAGSGTGTYVRGLLGGLAECTDLSIAAPCRADVVLPPNVHRRTVHRWSQRPRAALMENALRLPLELAVRRPRHAVFHNPSFHAPPAVGQPYVQTLHDVIPLVFDSPDLQALRARWRRFTPRYRRAAAVIAVSRFSADEGIRVLGLDPGRVHVAHHGIDAAFVPSGTGPSDPPYLLTVGEFGLRKGTAEAFAVMDELVDAGFPHRLVVAGQVHDAGRADLAALHADARHPERIDLLGYVPDLVSLYQGASGFLGTSRYEGFGLPALEAMACGVPVVAFANSAVTEVVGTGGDLVPDGDVSAMAAALRRILENPDLADERRQAGLQHAAQFTWTRSATLHAEVYRAVAAS